MKEFLTNMFSADEKRVSTLIICLVMCICFAFGLYIKRLDIPSSLQSIVQTLIYCVAGINSVDLVSKTFSKIDNPSTKL